MAFNGSGLSWSDFEARLSGRQFATEIDDAPVSRKRPAYRAAPIVARRSSVRFAELHAHSSYSFLDGASSPQLMAEEAMRLVSVTFESWSLVPGEK